MSPPGINFFSRSVHKAMNVLTPLSNHAVSACERGEHGSDTKEELSNLMPNHEYGFRTERMLREYGRERVPNPIENRAKPYITSEETLN
jgi:hypothetical protein